MALTIRPVHRNLHTRVLTNARALYQRALSAFREANDRWGIVRSLTDLAQIACDERDHVTAHAAYREALALFVTLGHKRGIARALEGFACSALAQRDSARALAIAAAAAHLRQWIGAPLMRPNSRNLATGCSLPGRRSREETPKPLTPAAGP